jgi:ubiquinone/menaquinone biosynthesis C-methylase UbiE
VSRQAARPHGIAGRLLARLWVSETAAVNDVAIDLLGPGRGMRILEIGFGPGRTLGRLAAAGAEVAGVEVSDSMLATAARRNAAAIAAGRVRLHRGDGTTLPLAAGSVDAVLGVHTIYFWPDPPDTLAETVRVLRPGGRIVLALRTADHPLPRRFDRTVYRVPTTEQAVDSLRTAGFTDIEVHKRPEVADAIIWLTAATPPASSTD